MFDFLSNVKGKKPSDPMADILSKSEEIKKSLSDLQRQLNGMGKKSILMVEWFKPRPMIRARVAHTINILKA
jgi:hypothetical protein